MSLKMRASWCSGPGDVALVDVVKGVGVFGGVVVLLVSVVAGGILFLGLCMNGIISPIWAYVAIVAGIIAFIAHLAYSDKQQENYTAYSIGTMAAKNVGVTKSHIVGEYSIQFTDGICTYFDLAG